MRHKFAKSSYSKNEGPKRKYEITASLYIVFKLTNFVELASPVYERSSPSRRYILLLSFVDLFYLAHKLVDTYPLHVVSLCKISCKG